MWQLCTCVLLTTEMAECHTGINIADRLTKMAQWTPLQLFSWCRRWSGSCQKIQMNCCWRVRATLCPPLVLIQQRAYLFFVLLLILDMLIYNSSVQNKREIAHVELISRMKSLEIDGDKVRTQHSIQRLMDHQLRGVRVLRKTALCNFSLALSQRKNLLRQAMMSWITSWKCLLLILTSMPWNDGKQMERDFPLCPEQRDSCCASLLRLRLLEKIFSTSGNIVTIKRELASNQTMWTC